MPIRARSSDSYRRTFLCARLIPDQVLLAHRGVVVAAHQVRGVAPELRLKWENEGALDGKQRCYVNISSQAFICTLSKGCTRRGLGVRNWKPVSIFHVAREQFWFHGRGGSCLLSSEHVLSQEVSGTTHLYIPPLTIARMFGFKAKNRCIVDPPPEILPIRAQSWN